MNNIIYDIRPPESLKEKRGPEKKKPPRKSFLFLPVFLLAVGAGMYFLIEPEAKVNIWPQTRLEEKRTTVSIDSDYSDFSKGIIKGQLAEREKMVSREFPSTFRVQNRAEGRITLYNKYTTAPETWQAGTRFISSEGKLFQSKLPIAVPGARIEGGKLIPSSVEVEVQAAEPGEEYNIGQTTFSVYVYRGTSRYSAYWAESEDPMEGGGQVLQVSKEDLEKAREALEEEAKEESKKALKEDVPEGWVVLEETIESEITDFYPLAEAGQKTESFQVQAKARSRAVAFEEKEILSFSKSFLAESLEEGFGFSEKSLQPSYSLSSKKSLEEGQFFLNLKISARVHSEIDSSSVKEKVSGKEAAAAERAILSLPGVNSAEIEISPFWAEKIPKKKERIKVNLVLD